jgi:DNA-binding NarL/FixJ family response regulator
MRRAFIEILESPLQDSLYFIFPQMAYIVPVLESGNRTAAGLKPISILVVAHSLELSDELCRILKAHADFQVVGTLTSGSAALRSLAQRKVDVVLVEMQMPGMEGLEITLRIKSEETSPRAIILTPRDGEAYRLAVNAAEADGYVPCELLEEVLPELIRSFFPKRPKPKKFKLMK